MSAKSYRFSFMTGISNILLLDIPLARSTVRLPYSLVPGMSIDSPLFFKAVATIAKQQEAPVKAQAVPVTTGDDVQAIAASLSGKEKEKSPQELSESFFYGLSFFFSNSGATVGLAKFLTNLELDNIERSRNIISDSVMTEIAQEDIRGQTEFENAVRHHIVSFYQRIRVSLTALDNLMEIYNSSRKNAF